MPKQWTQTNEGKLNRLKVVGQRCGWALISLSDTELTMVKDGTQNRYVDIDGMIEYNYNILEHSIVTTLRHGGKTKALKRWIQKGVWKPVEDALKYPRAHLGQNTKKYKYLKK